MNEPQLQIYEFGDFRLDAAKRLLTKGNDEPLPLTPKVFDTLLYLVRHSGKVIEKDELMREIWTDTVVEENNLSQNISILRRTLGEKAGEGRFIATVPGHGFRFVPDVRVLSKESSAPTSEFLDEGKEVTSNNEKNKAQISNLETALGPHSKPRTGDRKTNSRRFALSAALIVTALGSLGFYLWRENTKPASDTQIKTIAILPFKPLVAGNRDEALEMGMADTLIARLGNNREIVVRPLSSVRKFGNLEQDALTAGRALDVEAVLDGSVQRWGDGIRVNARLIKVADGSMLWTGTFDEKFTGIFAVQDAISNRVAAALALRLGKDEKMRLTKHQTENVEAYELYLRGRFHVFKLTPPEIQTGISYFQQAIAIDTGYALAYAGLADAYRSLALGSEMPPTEFLSKAKAAAQKAVELDDVLSEAHTALAITIFWGEWNWNEAENQFKRALELNPNSANAHLFYAHLLSNLGRHAEALAEIKLARELDPLFPFAGALEGQFLTFAGQTDEALERLRKTSELEPNFWMPHLFASSVYIEKEMYAEAVAEARLTRKLSPLQTTSVAYESYALAKSGRVTEARAGLDALLKLASERFVPPFHIALIYNGLGEQDEALAWLERGFEQRDTRMTFLKIDPKLNNLRREPRFIDLMQRMKFDE
jgi:DNA-binding winged helix-turn-helix (wHTH) protein/TolB-like protein/regulator of sirC expression with transglutaminase-like and TPR domain